MNGVVEKGVLSTLDPHLSSVVHAMARRMAFTHNIRCLCLERLGCCLSPLLCLDSWSWDDLGPANDGMVVEDFVEHGNVTFKMTQLVT
jgi:hypothetical protein